MSRARRAGRDLAVGLGAFAIVFSFGFVFGRALIPGFELALPDPGPEADATLPDPVLLRAELADVAPPAAVFASKGVIEVHAILDRAEALDRGGGLPGDIDPAGGDPVDVNIRFAGPDGLVLTVVADQMEKGERRDEGLTVVVTSAGQSFNGRPGMCAVQIDEIGAYTHPTPWGQYTRPTYSGWVACEGLLELRSDAPLSFVAAFRYDGS